MVAGYLRPTGIPTHHNPGGSAPPPAMSDHPVAGSGGLQDLRRQRRRAQARYRKLRRLVRLVWNASSRPHPTPCYHFNKYYYLILTSRRGLARRQSARPRPSQAPPHPAAPQHSTILAESRCRGGEPGETGLSGWLTGTDAPLCFALTDSPSLAQSCRACPAPPGL